MIWFIRTELFIAVCVFLVNCEVVKKNESKFIATKEWQVVEKGTPIPRGLHVRHNLQTGETQAKLMDEKEILEKSNSGKSSSLTIHPENPSLLEENNFIKTEKPSDSLKLSMDELKSTLKKIKSDESLDGSSSQNKDKEQSSKSRRKKFRSYSELKEELEMLSLNISTDSEVMRSFFEQFETYEELVPKIGSQSVDSSKLNDILRILGNLEYLMHQIDNAQLFADMGGISKIILSSLNSTNLEIKIEALKLLGAAVQSNPQVQLKALENDLVQKLLHILSSSNKPQLKSKCMFALGALVRNFPAAQNALISNGGLEIFGKILLDGNSQVQTRVMNLINDLTIERQNLKEIQDSHQRLERIKLYDFTNFEQKLTMQKYCQHLSELMIRITKLHPELDDFNKLVFESVLTMSNICKNDYDVYKVEILSGIQGMLNIISKISTTDEDDKNSHLIHRELLKKLLLVFEKLHDEL